MDKITAIIVDDEFHARENLRMLLEDHCPEVAVKGFAGGVSEALKVVEEVKPELIFLDIRMPSGAEGFDLIEAIKDKNFQVVFVTAFKDYAIRAFNANAVHYIMKPIDSDDLKLAVSKVLERKQVFSDNPQSVNEYFDLIQSLSEALRERKSSQRITINHAKGFRVVDDTSIVRLEAQGNCTALFFEDGSRYLDTRTMKVYEELLDPGKFFRIHKSHIINLSFLSEYLNEQGATVQLKDGSQLPVARNRVSDFVKRAKDQ